MRLGLDAGTETPPLCDLEHDNTDESQTLHRCHCFYFVQCFVIETQRAGTFLATLLPRLPPPRLREGLGSLHQYGCLINLAWSPSINGQVLPSAQLASGSRVRSIGDALARTLPPGVSWRSVTAPMVGLLLIDEGTQDIWVLPSPDSFLWGGLDIIIDVKVSQGPQDLAGSHDGYK